MKGRELVVDGLFAGVFSPGIMNVLIDSNNTISQGFKLIASAARTEVIKFGFSLFTPISTVNGTVSKGALKGLKFQFDVAGIAGDVVTGGGPSSFVPSFPQLGPLANLVKSTSSITEKALKGKSVSSESISQANGFIKDLINSFFND